MKRAIERFVLLGVLAGCCAVTAAAQSIPRGFEAAVAAETADGVKLVASAETTTYAGTYMAAVYQLPESDKDDSGYQRLKVHFLPPGAVMVRTMSLYTEAHVGLGTYEDGDTVFTDINNDGKIELIASVANGGNCWNCSQVLIYALDGPDLRWLAAEPMTISDVTGDGVPDLLVGDTRWESYGNFSHAGAPGGTMVYKWDSGRYVFAGAEASGFYNSMLDRIRADLPDAIKQINADDALSDEMYVGRVRQDRRHAAAAQRGAEGLPERRELEAAGDAATGTAAREAVEDRWVDGSVSSHTQSRCSLKRRRASLAGALQRRARLLGVRRQAQRARRRFRVTRPRPSEASHAGRS